MNDYELTVLLKPDLAEKELAKEIKAFSDVLEKVGAKIAKKAEPVKKSLVYEVAKLKEAFYVYFELSLKPEDVLVVDQKLKGMENIVRYLIVKKQISYK